MATPNDFDEYEASAAIVHDLALIDVLKDHGGTCPLCRERTYMGVRGGLPERVEAHTPECIIGRAQSWRAAFITSV